MRRNLTFATLALMAPLSGVTAELPCTHVFSDGFEPPSASFRVVEATATSATEVAVCFTAPIDVISLSPSGEQFLFDNGLSATSAAIAASENRAVRVGTNSQTQGLTYTLTVAASVKDPEGAGVDSGGNSAVFVGFMP
jgi:hypothetical protein